MTFDEWWEKHGCIYGDCKEFGRKVWEAARREPYQFAFVTQTNEETIWTFPESGTYNITRVGD